MLYRLYRDQVQAIEGAVEAWQAEHSSAMQARDVEDIVRSALGLPAGAEQALAVTLKDVEQEKVEDLDEAGQALRAIFERTLAVLATIRGLAREHEITGYHIDGLTELDSAIERVRALSERVLANWPWASRPFPAVDPQELVAARAERRRGEYDDLGDLIRALQGSPPPTC